MTGMAAAITSVSIRYKSAHSFCWDRTATEPPAKRWGVRIIGCAARRSFCSHWHMPHIGGRDRSPMQFARCRSTASDSGTTYRTWQVSHPIRPRPGLRASRNGPDTASAARRDSQTTIGQRRVNGMPMVRFIWSPILVEVRRESCPRARWDRARLAWTMTPAEVDLFVHASHRRLAFARDRGEILVDAVRWLVGDARGAPCTVDGTNTGWSPATS